MHDALLVCVAEGIAQMRGDGQGMLGGQLAFAGDHALYIGAVHELHDKVELPVHRTAEIIHADDGGVVHAAH